MKRLLNALLLVLLGIPAQAAVKVFIFAGQSNMGGYGDRLQLSPVPTWAQTTSAGWEGHPTQSSDTLIQYPHPTIANLPMLYNGNNTGLMSGVIDLWGRFEGERQTAPGVYTEESYYGPELSFLAKYHAAHPTEQIAAIKVSVGGSSIDEWLPSTNYFNILSATISQAAARIAALGQTVEWAGFFWHQGESGAASVWPYLYPTPGSEYSDKLRTLLTAVRAITSYQMPAVIFRIGNHMLADNIILPQVIPNTISTADNLRGATNYRRAQQALVASDPGNVLVDTDNLPVKQAGDPAYWYHHTSAGYLAMGERAFTAFAGAMPPPPPPPPLQTIVKINGVIDSTKSATVKLNGVTVGGVGDVLEVSIY